MRSDGGNEAAIGRNQRRMGLQRKSKVEAVVDRMVEQ
jgi:hypothetical protein